MATSATNKDVSDNLEDASNLLEDRGLSKPQEKLPNLEPVLHYKVYVTIIYTNIFSFRTTHQV